MEILITFKYYYEGGRDGDKREDGKGVVLFLRSEMSRISQGAPLPLNRN